jgi:sterol desaturase/sphingolipid hydroxylase (fatty acid hydroxylase superfamily)
MNGNFFMIAKTDQGFWNRRHHLDRMTLRELVVAYFQYPAIIAYLGLAAISAGYALTRPLPLAHAAAAVLSAVVIYPLAWYAIHRWILHSRWMFKVPVLASTWKRIHYDHHQDPNHLEVLFGALPSTLPTILIATAPLGWMIAGESGALLAFATGLLSTAFYEFCHCIQHLSYKPKNRFLADIKARHMAHHFHDEAGNFGITNFFWDRLFGTFYERQDRPNKSPNVFCLGYTPEMAKRYPKVAELSGGIVVGHPRQRDKA